MAEIYGDNRPGAHHSDRAKWAPLLIGALIVLALIVAILMRG